MDQDLPSTLKIGILPDESREVLLERYEPLRKHLSATLGLSCEIYIPADYPELIASFGAGSVDIAYFGGLTFVKAMKAHGAAPLVTRDVDTRFTTYFLVRAGSAATRIADCRDFDLAFGSRQSTSGHLMPRHFLATQDITPETFFRTVQYSGAHDTSIAWVKDGTVDIAAVNPSIFQAMVADKRIKKGAFRILWETPPYSNYIWAVQPSLGSTGRRKLRDAFLLLSPNHKEHALILKNLDAGGFYPAGTDAYSDLNKIAQDMGLLQ